MKKISLLIFILFLFTNCTIQKRVYRKGWNIRIEKNRNANEARDDQSELKQVETIDSVESIVSYELGLLSNDLSFSSSAKDTEEETLSEINTLLKTNQESSFKKEKAEIRKATVSILKDKSQDDEIKTHDGPVIGIVLIVTSMVMAALTVLILGASEITLVAIIGASVIGALGVLFLTLGIFFIIRKMREKKFPELKKARLERIKAKKDSPDYNPNKVNVLISAISFAIVIGLVILLRNIE